MAEVSTMMRNVPSPRKSGRGLRSFLPVLLAAALACLAVVPASAQLGFTEFALTDTSLNSSPTTDFWISSAAPADVDADGDLDLLIAGYFVIYPTEENPDGFLDHRLTLYRNDGAAGAEWVLTPVAVDASGLSASGADLAWGDYDNDGDPDVVLACEGQSVLYRNDGGTLVRTTTALPPYYEDTGFSTMDLHSLSWGDVDNDGDLDLLMPSVASDFEYAPTMVLRYDGPGPDDTWTFTDTGAALPITSNAVSAWADMEGDGDLDLLLGNISPYEDNFLNTYRNDGGTLVPAASDLALIRYGTADWGDADNDGDLDVVYGGNMDLPDRSGGETVVRILFNDGQGGYTPFDVVREFSPDPWLDFNAVAWADYDSDGDVDLLVSGLWLGPGEIEGRSAVYSNTGGTFTLVSNALPAPIAGNAGGAFTWFDVDGDGDLDYFVAGGYYVPDGNGLIEARTQLFRNDAPGANAAPAAASGLHATVSGTGVTLAWNAATDDRTPKVALTYELAVSKAAGAAGRAADILTTTARALPQPGSVRGNPTWTLRGLEPGVYQWSVRTVDNAFNGSPKAQGSFVIGSTVGVGEPSSHGFALSAPCPSPFRGETRFALQMVREEHVNVSLYDLQGHRVAVLHDGPLGPGIHSLGLEAGGLPSGLYFIRARGGDQTAVRRVMLVR
jgi:hypothetical protein